MKVQTQSARSFKAFFVLTCLWMGPWAQAREIVDVTGARVHVSENPSRIVTLAPSLGELVAEILQMDLSKIVGVSDRTDYPPTLEKIPSVGSFASFNVEKVLSLKPDLVFATTDGNPKDRIDQLREQGLAVIIVNNSSIQDIEESFGIVARALGRDQVGQTLSTALKKGIKRIRSSVPKVGSGSHRPKTLLQIGTEPLVVVGRGSFLSEALDIVEADNVYGDLKSKYPKPTLEDVIQRRPDWILVVGMEQDLTLAKKMADEWKTTPFSKGPTAVRVAVLPGDTLLRPSLRLLDGLTLLRDTLYGRRTQVEKIK